jgi:NAD/NADP transhydrogenase beta subunit
MMSVLSMEVILGGLTFTGSLMAAGQVAGNPAAAADYL